MNTPQSWVSIWTGVRNATPFPDWGNVLFRSNEISRNPVIVSSCTRAPKLGWVMHGFGENLSYSLESTLVNCLPEELRGDREGYASPFLCPTFYEMLKLLEIWSVADFVSQMRAPESGEDSDSGLSPFSKLCGELATCDSNLGWVAIMEAQAQARELLDLHRSRFERFGEELVFATMLGFLIDELLARTAVPNGMGFGYRFTLAVLSALQAKLPSLRDPVKRMGVDIDQFEHVIHSLITNCQGFNDPAAPRQALEHGWRRLAEGAADQLRRVGFACRKLKQLNEEEANLVFSASNAIWRWIFFLEQRVAFEGLSPSLAPTTRVARVTWCCAGYAVRVELLR